MHSMASEKAIVKLILENPELYPEIFSQLNKEDFYFGVDDAQTGLIIKTVQELKESGLDFTDFHLLLTKLPKLTQGYFEKFLELPAKVENLQGYIDDVRRTSEGRFFTEYKTKIGSSESVERAEELLKEMKGKIYEKSDFSDDKITAVMDRYLMRVEVDKDLPLEERRMDTPFVELNTILGGLYRSDLTIFAGRPGMGKTAWLSQLFIDHLTSHYPNDSFAYGILETSREQLLERFIAERTGITVKEIRDLTFFNDKVKTARFHLAIDQLRGKKVLLWGSECKNVNVLKRKVMKEQGSIKLLVVDYLQLMHTGKRDSNRNNQLGDIVQDLADLAVSEENNGMHVLAAAQLSRAVESRQSKKPVLSDLRDSGEIEQAAHNVMFIYRDSYYNETSEMKTPLGDITEIIVAKNRNNMTGSAFMIWKGDDFKFSQLPKGFDIGTLSQDNTTVDTIFG